MKAIKALSWVIFSLLSLCGIILLVTIIVAASTSYYDEFISLICRGLLLACFCLVCVTLILGFANLLVCIKCYKELSESSFTKTNLVIKLGLIPFFIINFVFWGILWLGTFNMFLLPLAPFVWVISLSSTYLFLLISSTPNIVFVVTKLIKTKDWVYIVYGILHFIYLADVVGALLLHIHETKDKKIEGEID